MADDDEPPVSGEVGGAESLGDEVGSAPDDESEPMRPAAETLAVILAAGAGSRYERDEHKLEVKLNGRPLVWWASHHAVIAGFSEVLVIEGAFSVAELVDEHVSVVHNHDWQDGQARTLHVAVHYAQTYGYESLVVGLADQPFVPPDAWRRIAASESPIAVAQFRDGTTPPVRLHADVWGLLPYDGDEGARQLLRTRPDLVTPVACPGSPVDVDTAAALDLVRRNPLCKELGTWT